MQFLFPSFLWALAILAIPIIIHLFHFRRFKKVYFTNVHLLKEIKEETSQRNKLRDLLVLLTRILALGLFVLAFAQPVLTKNRTSQPQNRVISVFVDNSFSMKATKDEIPLLTLAKDKARELVSTYSETEQFLVLSHDFEAKHQRLVDRQTALNFIEEIELTAHVEQLSTALELINRITRNEINGDRLTFLISDFQQNISSFETPADTTVELNLVPIRSLQENNVSIDACFFEAPVPMLDVSNNLIVSITNYGQNEQEVQLTLRYGGQERPQGIMRLPPGSSQYDTIALTINRPGWHDFELKIVDFPVEFDDRLFGAFEIKEQIDILNIYDDRENDFLNSVFESNSFYRIEQVRRQNVKYDQFRDQELIVLNGLSSLSTGMVAELATFVSEGGNLLIFPSPTAPITTLNQLLNQVNADTYVDRVEEPFQVTRINSEEFIFNNVFVNTRRNIRLPSTTMRYTMTRNQLRNRDGLLLFPNDDPYLVKYQFERGNVYVCTSPLDEEVNDLVRNAEIFVPMLYKMAISSGLQKSLYAVIGQDEAIEFDQIRALRSGNYIMRGQDEFIPGIIQTGRMNFLDVSDQIEQAGIYSLFHEDSRLGLFAFNYNRTESDVRLGNLADIQNSLGNQVQVLDDTALADLSAFILEKHEGVSLWRWCLILALLFLLVESVFLRLWK